MSGLLTAREVAELLHIHVNTVKRIPRYLLPYFIVVARGDRRYDNAAVQAYLDRLAQR